MRHSTIVAAWAFAVLAFSPDRVSADPAVAVDGSVGTAVVAPKLPGAGRSLEKLLAKPEVVVAVGVLKSLGDPSMNGGPGKYDYDEAKFKITKFLRGACKRSVMLLVDVGYAEGESVPIEGTKYILFIYPSPTETSQIGIGAPVRKVIRGLKLLPVDPETMSVVTKAIAAARSAKPGAKEDGPPDGLPGIEVLKLPN
jgi:hypothetical protein